MRSIKTILLGTILAAGFGFFVGTSDANADTLYTVQSGDTLSKIALHFDGDNVLMQQIADKNNIDNVNMIYTGQELTIPDSTKSEPAKTEPAKTEPAAAQPKTETAAPETTTAVSSSAKEWIAQKESSGSYTATNGRYIGRYQLDASYLNGDYSPANQEKVADAYVAQRYGSWEAAQAFWLANGWY